MLGGDAVFGERRIRDEIASVVVVDGPYILFSLGTLMGTNDIGMIP